MRINKLEKELFVSIKECEVLSDNLKCIKEKVRSDEKVGNKNMQITILCYVFWYFFPSNCTYVTILKRERFLVALRTG